MADRSGQLLGNYRLLRQIGQGGFSDVYLGEHIHLRTQAAIKVLQVHLGENTIQNFLKEARMIAHLVHPHIIRVLDFGVQASTPFLVMDYAPNGTLRQRYMKGVPLPAALLVPYIKQTADALQYAHERNLIHRDVKPDNMLLGTKEEVLLSDFGLARIAHESNSRSRNDMAGTAIYMAPEQLQGRPLPASDQYSLGIVAYEWLTGNAPFQGSFFEIASQHMMSPPLSMRAKSPHISAALETVVMTALAKDPQRRFPSVRDFAIALEQACSSIQAFTVKTPTTTHYSPKVAPDVPAAPNILKAPDVPNTPGHPGPNTTPLPTPVKPANPSFPLKQMHASTSGWQERQQASLHGNQWTGGFPAPGMTQKNATPAQQKTPISQSSPRAFAFPPLEEPVSQTGPQVPAQLSPFRSGQRYQSQSRLAVPIDIQFPLPEAATTKPVPPVPPESPKKRSPMDRTVLHIIVVLLLIMLCGGFVLFAVISHAPTNTSPGTQASATSTVTPKTATPALQGTPTATLPNPYPPHTGTLVMNDAMSDNRSGWHEDPVTTTSGDSCHFVGGSYHVVRATSAINPCFAAAADYNNFTYQVHMTFLKVGQQFSGGGIVFRGDATANTYYAFELYESGRFSFRACNGTDCTRVLAGDPVENLTIPAFHSGLNQSNELSVVAKGATFDIYVNGQHAVGPITDASYTRGQVGVYATGGTEGGPEAVADVVFSGAKVWKLS